jgi:hypothetical protein
MSSHAEVRIASAPLLAPGGRGLLRWICTSNPFYVLSAGLFLAGLYISFGAQEQPAQTWALMSGLAGYTLLLAVTACLLVRLAGVWDDARTILLLVVLMFLATSVTFDELLVMDPARGLALYLGGLVFAIAVSEGLLRGIRLRLPALFRLPYYLILSLFFLYPLALRPLLDDPHSEALQWGLFGFASVAGGVFLTLVPAIRHGSGYVRDNGSPWPWPLYPWALFVFLAVAVLGRAFFLCWSLHLLASSEKDQLIFGLYFLVPFGLALAVLLLEIGITSLRLPVMRLALAVPAALAGLSLVGHRNDSIYRGFWDIFTSRLGGDPLAVTLVLSAIFYAYAALRRVPHATDALSADLLVLTLTGTSFIDRGPPEVVWLAPLVGAAMVQLGVGIAARQARGCLLGLATLAAAAMFTAPPGLGVIIAFHVALVGLLVLGALFGDWLGRLFRGSAHVLACLVLLATVLPGGTHLPLAWLVGYPLLLAVVLAVHGRLLRLSLPYLAPGVILAAALLGAASQGYRLLRGSVAGLDHIAVSLALFAVAVLVSLGKAGILSRWLSWLLRKTPEVRQEEARLESLAYPERGIFR